MKKNTLILLSFFQCIVLFAQDLYFPPINGDEWETMAPEELNWCSEKIDTFYSFLDEKNSKAVILLVDGKIVLEKYFDDFTKDDLWHWASVGKPMMGTLMAIAEQQDYLNLDDPTYAHLGLGWTSAPHDKEILITLRHHLSMTTGLDDATNTCTLPSCLNYLADAGTRWAYHNATYYLLADVLESATGKDFNQIFDDEISAKTGIDGDWANSGYAKILSTTPRDMARFGLLFLNQGIWDGNTIVEDQALLNQMIIPSQPFNKSYGYYWWLNGQESHMFPGTQEVFEGSLSPDAPADLYTGIGNGGQYLNIIPSKNMVLVRMGDFPGGPLQPNIFNNEMWQFINDFECTPNTVEEDIYSPISIYPNPTQNFIAIEVPREIVDYKVTIHDALGNEKIKVENTSKINIELLPSGIYHLTLKSKNSWMRSSFIKQ